MTAKESELLEWTFEFYMRCKKLEYDILDKDWKRKQEYKSRYKDLKLEIKAKKKESDRFKYGKDFLDKELLNRCKSNISECSAWGFTAPTNSNDLDLIYRSVEEGSYKISKFLSQTSVGFEFEPVM